jgi:prepilin-type N-terminal cleavage/methylation domain-containing protein|tara:strand:- start:555 stop:1139 length:585 start_codon:yes stop_codon:yes gene_type:complete
MIVMCYSKKMELIMRKHNNFKKQGGFTFIELMIAVVIIGVAWAFIAPQLQGLMDRNVTVQSETGAMTRTFNQIQDRYFDEIIDSDFNTEVALRGRLFAEAYNNNGIDTVYNIFDGDITVAGVADNGWTWVSSKIPTNSCASLITTAKTVGYETFAVSGASERRYSEASKDDIATDCETGDNNDTVTITWTKEES